MEYGQLIRQIRLEKGFSQKETYIDIITKSYSIEFEKGNHDLSFKLLEQVLERLMVDMEEFIFLYNFYQEPNENLWKRYELASNNNDIEAIFDIYNKSSYKPDKKNHLLRSLSKIKYDFLSKPDNTQIVDSDDLLFLTDYLKSIETWTLQETKIYANMINYFSNEQQKIFYRNSLKKINIYKDFPLGKKIYLTLLLNSCGNFISQRNLKLAEDAIEHLKLLATGTEDMIFKLYVMYFENVVAYCKGEKKNSQKELSFVINTLSKLNYRFLSEQCSNFFNEVKEEY